MVNETLVEDFCRDQSLRIQELDAINAKLLDRLKAARRYIEYNIPATEVNGKLLYSIRETLAKATGN